MDSTGFMDSWILRWGSPIMQPRVRALRVVTASLDPVTLALLLDNFKNSNSKTKIT